MLTDEQLVQIDKIYTEQHIKALVAELKSIRAERDAYKSACERTLSYLNKYCDDMATVTLEEVLDLDPMNQCDQCKGVGYFDTFDKNDKDIEVQCTECDGKGYLNADKT